MYAKLYLTIVAIVGTLYALRWNRSRRSSPWRLRNTRQRAAKLKAARESLYQKIPGNNGEGDSYGARAATEFVEAALRELAEAQQVRATR